MGEEPEKKRSPRAKPAGDQSPPEEKKKRTRAESAVDNQSAPAEKKKRTRSEPEPEQQEVESKDTSVIKQGSIASFMRKRTQLVGFDSGHFKHVQYTVEFIDNSLDAIESFHWKNTDLEIAYQLDSGVESGLDKLVNLEAEFMDANTTVAHGLSPDLANVFTSMGESNGESASMEGQSSASTQESMVDESDDARKVEVKSKLVQQTDIDAHINSIVEAMGALINPYIDRVLAEPIIILKLSEVEDPSLTFLDEKTAKLYCFEIFDSGTGIGAGDLERFGTYLASSKSEKLKQTRGSQGFGSPSAFSDAQNTTGKPIQVISKHYKAESGNITEFFTTGENKKSFSIETQKIDTDFKHGTYVRLYYTNVKYKSGFVDVYVKQTALMNSHVTIILIDPYGDVHEYPRLVTEFPDEPKYAKPHPTSMNIGEFQDMLRTTSYSTLKQFLTHSFVRISDKNAQNIIYNAEDELQDKVGMLELSGNENITIPEKADDFVYLLKEEQRVYGKSTKARKKMVIYLLNVGKADAVDAYKGVYTKYKATLKEIGKIDSDLKKSAAGRDSAEKKKDRSEISKHIKELEKSKKDAEKSKEELKKEFHEYTNAHKDAFEEITNENVENVIMEKYNTITVSAIEPKNVLELQVNTLYKYFTVEKYLSPPTDTAIPVGADVLESVLIQEFGLQISKFDSYFADDEGATIENDTISLPATQKELKAEAEESGEEDPKYQALIKLSEDDFVRKMAAIPLIKVTELTDTVKKDFFKDLVDFAPEAYRQPELYAEEIMEEDLDFVSAVTRPPTSGKGLAFIVEAAIAYGSNVKTPAKPADVVYRFVNRTPKLRDNADCAIWKTVCMVNWKNYMVDMFDNGIPKSSIRIFINVSGPFVHLMFKSQSKQALAEDDNLLKEIKLALEQVGRRLKAYISKKQKHADSKKRASRFILFAPHVARALFNILNNVPEYKGKIASVDTIEEKIVMAIASGPAKKAAELPSQAGEKPVAPLPVKGPASPVTIAKPAATQLAQKPATAGISAPKPSAVANRLPEAKPSLEKKAPVQQKLGMPAAAPAKPLAAATPAAKPPASAKPITQLKPGAPLKPTPSPVPAPGQAPAPAGAPVKLTEENILKYMPEGKYVKISYIIKALNITDITEARFLEVKLKTLINQGKIEREMQDGKSYYKRK
jgi:DNA topoisomerase VI B subunit